MRIFSLIVLLTLTATVSAGGFSTSDIDTYDIDTYDEATGIYYKAYIETGSGLLSKVSGSRISNVYIFDPSTNEGSLLLPQDSNRLVSFFAFETSYLDGSILFDGQSGFRVKNNSKVAKRSPKNKILYGLWDEESERVTLFTCTKLGSDISKLTVVPKDASFHIDIRNSKVKIVEQDKGRIKIKSFDW